MLFLFGTLPILSALLGFLIFSNPNPEIIAGESIGVIENTSSEIKISPDWQPTPTPSPSPTSPIKTTPAPSITGILVYPYKTITPAPLNSSLDLLQQVNNFRASKGLNVLTANDETCFFAKLRANEITSNFNHDGFRDRIDSKSLPYSSWSEVAENIAINPDSNAVVAGWIGSPGHNENLSKNVPYGCVANSGHYYVFEAMKP